MSLVLHTLQFLFVDLPLGDLLQYQDALRLRMLSLIPRVHANTYIYPSILVLISWFHWQGGFELVLVLYYGDNIHAL